MRTLALLALFTLMGLAGVFILGGPGLAPEAADAAVAGAAPAGGDAGGTRAGHRGPARGSGPTFYTYTDEHGGTHYVQHAARVPDRYRRGASTIELESHVIRPTASAPSGGQAQPARPAFAFDPDQKQVRRQARADVVVYTAPWCGWCRKTLAWLDERGVDYENRDIESDPAYREELIRKTGNASIPMVEVDGEQIRGFSPRRMRELLEI